MDLCVEYCRLLSCCIFQTPCVFFSFLFSFSPICCQFCEKCMFLIVTDWLPLCVCITLHVIITSCSGEGEAQSRCDPERTTQSIGRTAARLTRGFYQHRPLSSHLTRGIFWLLVYSFILFILFFFKFLFLFLSSPLLLSILFCTEVLLLANFFPLHPTKPPPSRLRQPPLLPPPLFHRSLLPFPLSFWI